MNRVEAARIALKQAKDKAKGAIIASDAFFPFDDVVKLAAEYGIMPSFSLVVQLETRIRSCG